MNSQTFILPDLLANWPFRCFHNPLSDEVVPASAAWIEGYNIFDERAQKAFNRCNFGLFTSLAYPNASAAHFRTCADLMNFFFVFDELSDEADGPTVRKQAADIMYALRNPYAPPPPGETILGEMARCFWRKGLQEAHISPTSGRRFIANFDEYTHAVCRQAEDRDCGRTRNLSDYLELRRGTIGVRPSFDFFILTDDVPDEVVKHPQVEKLVQAAIDMTIIANDVYSYNVEQSRGDDAHNIVAVTMMDKGLDIQGAMDYVGRRYHQIARTFIDDMKHVPTFPGQIGRILREYVFGLGIWVTTNIEWSFAGERYFGNAGPSIKVHRRVELLPKRR
ncbi:terpenoid synthase [Desarmillaria tabescens]|uniref:Terpene synthase n=1 Tax=Armillaria tabescens TaxID=1929756 RepID=A0AA39KDC2_ARMTA|nr:terpenoid synthase [Desarmillaria tabescens]KAK0458907.1 terpenoid synthase [Desarmillaria tabescens]